MLAINLRLLAKETPRNFPKSHTSALALLILMHSSVLETVSREQPNRRSLFLPTFNGSCSTSAADQVTPISYNVSVASDKFAESHHRAEKITQQRSSLLPKHVVAIGTDPGHSFTTEANLERFDSTETKPGHPDTMGTRPGNSVVIETKLSYFISTGAMPDYFFTSGTIPGHSVAMGTDPDRSVLTETLPSHYVARGTSQADSVAKETVPRITVTVETPQNEVVEQPDGTVATDTEITQGSSHNISVGKDATSSPPGEIYAGSQGDAAIPKDFNLTIGDCGRSRTIIAEKGTLYGIPGFRWKTRHLCEWVIDIPEHFRHMHFMIEPLDRTCQERYRIFANRYSSYDRKREETGLNDVVVSCISRATQFISHGKVYFAFSYNSLSRYPAARDPSFRVDFVASNETLQGKLEVTFDTPTSGSITQWGYNGVSNCLCEMDAAYKLELPVNHVVMISFSRFHVSPLYSYCILSGLDLYSVTATKEGNKTYTKVISLCSSMDIITTIYRTTMVFYFYTGNMCKRLTTGFKALFSFHPASRAPQELGDGVFNCSGRNYPSFRDHLRCNLADECVGQEDEGGFCPYSSPECMGFVSSGNKCYMWMMKTNPMSHHAAQVQCRRMDAQLATIKTLSEWEKVLQMYQYGKHVVPVIFGLRTGDGSLPGIYRYSLKWVDHSIAQTVDILSMDNVQDYKLKVSPHRDFEQCGILTFDGRIRVAFVNCTAKAFNGFHDFICEKTVISQENPVRSVDFPLMAFPFAAVTQRTALSMVSCDDDHAAHNFLACDPQTKCQFLKKCNLNPGEEDSVAFLFPFVCDDEGSATLPYTLVCDFRDDCPDGSDERFCVHSESCAGFMCRNKQCVDRSKRCDWDNDCLDKSDEENCDDVAPVDNRLYTIDSILRLPPPVIISYHRNRTISQKSLNPSEPCPITHFRCPDDYCLPVYLRCNGVDDCPGREDEHDCDTFRCPGFYLCRGYSQCVHADDLCDGFDHCPQGDDEKLCNERCPLGCQCQGHAFTCLLSISLIPFPNLRYLDAARTLMGPKDISGALPYLVWLRLAACRLTEITRLDLPNLQTLDLSHNYIVAFRLDEVEYLANLRTLKLSGNPLTTVFVGGSGSGSGSESGSGPGSDTGCGIQHDNLRVLELSHGNLVMTEIIKVTSCFPTVTHLNVSFNAIRTINATGFVGTSGLERLDLRGNPMKKYPLDLLKPLVNLRSIFTDDYRLCCRQILPDSFFVNDGQCSAPKVSMASCGNLIHSRLHRVLIAIFMAVAVLGNLAWLVYRLCVLRKAPISPVDLFVTNLNLMDLLMGTYSVIIFVTDLTYRDRYFFAKEERSARAACTAGGALALVSYEATAFLTGCLTVYGVLVALSNSGSRHSVTRRFAVASCVVSWSVALSLTLFPLLPSLSRWSMQNNSTNICIPVPMTTEDSSGFRGYRFAVMVIGHFLISIVNVSGQLKIYWLKITGDDLELSISDRSLKMAEASRASVIILVDSVRRFSVGLARIAGFFGSDVPDEFNVFFSVLLMPCNSALNPLLYALSLLQERRRLASERRLLERLSCRRAQQACKN